MKSIAPVPTDAPDFQRPKPKKKRPARKPALTADNHFQEAFFRYAIDSKKPITVWLSIGQKINGRVVDMDRYTVALQTNDKLLAIPKHAIVLFESAAIKFEDLGLQRE